MIKTWSGLGRSLIRLLHYWLIAWLAVSTFCLAFPAFGLSSDDFEEPSFVRIYTLTSLNSAFDYTTEFQKMNCYGDAYSLYLNHPFGIVFETDTGKIRVPDFSGPFTNSTYDVAYPIQSAFLSGGSVHLSPYLFENLRSLFVSLVNLYNSGYRGAGVEDVNTRPTAKIHGVNFNYRLIVADVLSSTNSTYRQIILSHLSQIQSSVVNIDTGVSALVPSVDLIVDINSSIASNSLDAVSLLRNIDTNFPSVVSPLSTIASNSSFSASMERFANLPIVDFHSYIESELEQGSISEASAASFLQSYDGYSNPTSRAVFASRVARNIAQKAMAYNFLFAATRDRNAQYYLEDFASYFNEPVVDALIGDYPVEESKGGSKAFNTISTSIKSQLQSWRNEAKQQLNDWKSDLKSDLQAWKTSDETGYLNVKKSIDDNFTYTERNRTNQLPFTAFQTNFVTRPLTNIIYNTGSDIQSNATGNADRQIEAADDRWDEFKSIATGNGDGLNVKIKFPLWESDGYHVNVRDDAVVQAIQDGVHIVNPDLTQISDSFDSFLDMYSPTNSFDWQPWFEKWDPFAGITTNLFAEYNSSRPAAEIASGFLSNGFDFSSYENMPWFQRVEVLLAMIANVDSNAVEVADIEEAMEDQVTSFRNLSTNVVSVSGDVVGLFDYVRRLSVSLQSLFGDRASPLTGDYVLLPAGHWIGDQSLTLRINPNIQNLCRLIMQCIWYLGFLVLLWIVVSWVWQKVVAVLRWLWSMFDV